MGEVHWSSPGMLNLTTDAVLEGLQRLSAAAHEHGMKLFQQLLHGGPTNIPHDGSAPWAASPIPDTGLGMVCRPMTTWMIDEVVAGFAGAAQRAVAGGIDGLEIHAGHGYLFSAFLSPATNRRTDDYGGPLENRARILVDVLTAVRGAVGPDYPVGVRLSADGPDDQTTRADIATLAAVLESRGLIDYLNLSYGSHYRRDLLMGATHEPHGYQLAAYGDTARAAALPTIVTGRIMTIAEAARIIAAGTADLVSMVRATIADPELVEKARTGRTGETKPCISCNQACVGGLNLRGRVSCVVNPGAGRELRLGDDHLVARTVATADVLVVGGGPAGMEAARSAALAGHHVTLYESAESLGGQLRLARQSPARAEVAKIIPFYERELERLGVDVRLGTEASIDDVVAADADLVVLATGSVPRRDGFQTWRPAQPPDGWATIDPLTSHDVLTGAALGHRVLLLDEVGHYEAIDVAEYLVDRGHRVHHVTKYTALSANLEARWDMIGAAHMRRLLAGDYEIATRSIVLEVGPSHAVFAPIDGQHRRRRIDVDSVVALSGNLPRLDLADALQPRLPLVRVVGDAAGPRMLEAAITEGQMAVRSLEPGWTKPPGLRFGQTGSAI